jgi:hypothetical protein
MAKFYINTPKFTSLWRAVLLGSCFYTSWKRNYVNPVEIEGDTPDEAYTLH